MGSHTNSIGICGDLFGQNRGSALNAGLVLEGSAGIDISCLCIEGPQYWGRAAVGPIVGFGKAAAAQSPWNSASTGRRNEYRLSYIGYFDSKNTSQVSGRLEYLYREDRFAVGFIFEDDFLALRNHDEYRTAALEIGTWLDAPRRPFSLYLGTRIWTGSAIGSLSRTEEYDLTTVPYGSHSAGILYLGAGRKELRISVGWDSEHIRDAVQNSFHRMIDDGILPVKRNQPDRFFLSLRFFDLGSLY